MVILNMFLPSRVGFIATHLFHRLLKIHWNGQEHERGVSLQEENLEHTTFITSHLYIPIIIFKFNL